MMTETLLLMMMGKLVASSALLFTFYWLVLRNRATYALARLYLLLIPFASLAMSGLTFGVYPPQAADWGVHMPAGSEEALPKEVPTAAVVQYLGELSVAPIVVTDGGRSMTADDWCRLLMLLCGAVSVVLMAIAAYHFITLYLISRRLEGEPTPEGYWLVRSSQVTAPCSFGKTIFMPIDLIGDKEELILRHEKAHISHGHFADIWVIELTTRLLWFNPFLWLARRELRNVHEFEADHDVLEGGADVAVYQTVLLAQAVDSGSSYANGFSHSFIRRRFIEMKHSKAGTLGRLSKVGMGAWLVLLFCGFTFTERKADWPVTEGAVETKTVTERTKRLSVSETVAVTKVEGEPNFWLNVKVTQGINDSGYLIKLYNQDLTRKSLLADIPTRDKRTSFTTTLGEPCMGEVRATFPDGSICTRGMYFPFVPGERAELRVMNGFFHLTGSKFYREWGAAEELVENARRYEKWAETEALLVDYLKKHAYEEGCVMYYLDESVLPVSTIRALIPDSMLKGRFKNLLAFYLG